MWNHYTSPIANKLMSIVEDYGIDIFLGRGNPLPKIREHELNLLQRIVFLSP
ncbi:MAG: hypothetical protein N0E59_04015 [Candidatus Thiodiazotropha taylori]|uniref:Uncharacterized protein n=1 Tax=Candidatus Thiodiazotropha taylori TaxID=2792791 RepID=A0A9E4KDK8_9GAMM|nr:hypothetical protein [Candidatus Thiodiazotropha taylori]MCG8107629.1 hypothetical protein [Candidatus Thiodiazotropha taylori]MCG8109907.1 hypothetical protein [Candidatus Thiodiazotropha taylori]MCW4282251.1 hypothetical protein [Candidatus Thiodiazotropha taylori]